MKKLSQEELSDFTFKKAQEVAEDYADFLAKRGEKISLYGFQNELPWDKGSILVALLKLLRDSNDQEYKKVACNLIVSLEDFIPTLEEYKEIIELEKLGDELNQLNKTSPISDNGEIDDNQLKEFIKRMQ